MSPAMESARASRAPVSARIEADLLIALGFVVPLFEAPKNILCVALLVVWLANRVRSRAFAEDWDLWDALIAVWIASGFVVAAFAGIHGDEWHAAADIVRYGTVLWILKRSRYPDSTWLALILAIVAGTIAALVWSYYDILVTGEHQALGLHSVGHVNQSANYLAIACGVALMMARAEWHSATVVARLAYAALLAFFVVSLFWMESRAAVGAAFVLTFFLLSAYSVRRGEGLARIALIAVVAAALVLWARPQVVEKNTEFMEKNYFLNGRQEIWRTGFSAWREFPVLGVGMDNFGRIDVERLSSWSAKRGESFKKQDYLTAPHGHSLFVNALAERGLLGFSVLLAVLAAWGAALFRPVPGPNAKPLVWVYWGGATGAWIITVLAGLLNTTLHHEQALLSMLLLGGWLSLSRTVTKGSVT